MARTSAIRNLHNCSQLPVLLLGKGGNLKGGQHISAPKDTPLANVLLTVAQRANRQDREVRRRHRHVQRGLSHANGGPNEGKGRGLQWQSFCCAPPAPPLAAP